MKKLLFATGNESKAKRFSEKLRENGIEVISLKDIDCPINVIEDGTNAIENALIKARAYYKKTGMITMGMDDNLYIENISDSDQPGLFVRRINGKILTDEEMIEHYVSLINKYSSDGKLTAKWVYGLALIVDGKEYTYSWSKEDFYLVNKPSKVVNSGYPLNSISVNKKLNKYFSELTDEDKKSIVNTDDNVIDFIIKNINY